MKIVWDERKRQLNIEKHGLDFALLDDFDWDTANIVPAHLSPAGQVRWKATGPVSTMLVSVIFAMLGSEAISAVSLRPASRRERREYEWSSSRSTRH